MKPRKFLRFGKSVQGDPMIWKGPWWNKIPRWKKGTCRYHTCRIEMMLNPRGKREFCWVHRRWANPNYRIAYRWKLAR